MKTILISLLSCAAFAQAAITPVNSGFEDLSGTFPSGWNPSGTVSQTLGLGSPIAASLAAGASVHQDFAPTLADGLVTFTTSFTLRLEGTGGIATNTSRIRIRGNNNAGDLITLRLSSAGLECATNGTWAVLIPFANQLGTAYNVTLEVANLDADADMEYRSLARTERTLPPARSRTSGTPPVRPPVILLKPSASSPAWVTR